MFETVWKIVWTMIPVTAMIWMVLMMWLWLPMSGARLLADGNVKVVSVAGKLFRWSLVIAFVLVVSMGKF